MQRGRETFPLDKEKPFYVISIPFPVSFFFISPYLSLSPSLFPSSSFNFLNCKCNPLLEFTFTSQQCHSPSILSFFASFFSFFPISSSLSPFLSLSLSEDREEEIERWERGKVMKMERIGDKSWDWKYDGFAVFCSDVNQNILWIDFVVLFLSLETPPPLFLSFSFESKKEKKEFSKETRYVPQFPTQEREYWQRGKKETKETQYRERRERREKKHFICICSQMCNNSCFVLWFWISYYLWHNIHFSLSLSLVSFSLHSFLSYFLSLSYSLSE